VDYGPTNIYRLSIVVAAPEFEQRMAEVLCVYLEEQVLKKDPARSNKSGKRVEIVFYDEKPGI
jgi:hypothetical protein